LSGSPYNGGPGGPILVVTNAGNPFSEYYAEILLAEGLNCFALQDISAVAEATLTNYDLVILGEMALSSSQVTTLSNWVYGGGKLVAMRPDKKLAGLLGLSDAGTNLSEAYLLVNTASGPGMGIVAETIQYHGTADLYALDGATTVATLYANATLATVNPAVTLRSIGLNGGQAAAFAYDLARSVVFTRQGNPAWVNQNRDVEVEGPYAVIRPDDMFYGNAPGDSQPDWVDPSKIAIPQADEQQRLLANLIISMTFPGKLLPRFWYFPHGHRAVVVMTSDNHGSGTTAAAFDQQLAASPVGGSVEDWETIRSSVYVFPGEDLTKTGKNDQFYNTNGFEIGIHIDTECSGYTPASLDDDFTSQFAQFNAEHPGLPAPASHRIHCVAWSDYATLPEVELSYGIRLNTTYYYFPAAWVANQPGVFTGSAMPMRFATMNGNVIDVYQAATQMTDESGQGYPYTIDTLLNRALGPESYYGAYVANIHTDADSPERQSSLWRNAIITSAIARGVPVVSGQQMLTWLDGRNNSRFASVSWDNTNLSFSVVADSRARGIQALVPIPAGDTVSQVRRGVEPVVYSLKWMKGVHYVAVPVVSGDYVITYSADTNPPSVTGITPADGATGVSVSTAVTISFNEPMDEITVNTDTIRLNETLGGVPVAATVTYNPSTQTATAVLAPTDTLLISTAYTVTVKGGAGGVKDVAGNALASDYTSDFTTTDTLNYHIWPTTATPAIEAVDDAYPYELGVKFRSDRDGYVTGIRFYKGAGNGGTHLGNLWTTSGLNLATAVFTGETSNGWQEVNFEVPVAIGSNTTYVASYFTPQGHYAVNGGYFTSAGEDNPPLHALANGVDGGNGVFIQTNNSSFPNQTYNAANYWVDVVFVESMGPDTNAPVVLGVNPGEGAEGVSVGTAVAVAFSEAMDAASVTNGTAITLSNATAGLVAASVSYYAGTNTAILTPDSPLAYTNVYTVRVRGGVGGVADVATNYLASDFTASFTTEAPDLTPPEVVGVSPMDGAVEVSLGTEVVVTFSEAMEPSTINGDTISLRDSGGGVVPAVVVYNPSALEVTAVLTPTSQLTPATTYTVVVTNGAAGVTDLAGNTLTNVFTASFITTDQTEFSLWDEFSGTADGGDSSAVEVGLKFQSALSGYVTGIRFYKSAANTGTHVGNLWGGDGTPLARVTFLNETGTGWQSQAFTNPVPIAANSTYVVSYHAPAGHYSITAGAFTLGVTNYPLRALSSSDGGGNGVFVYSTSSAFPANSYNAANYWVDVVFTPDSGPDINGPTVVGVSPVDGAEGVSPATVVSVTFSEAMDALSVTNGITLTNSLGQIVAGTVAYYTASNTAVLTPDSALALGSSYTVVVASGVGGVKDVAGNGLTNVFTASFTTVIPDTAGPVVLGVEPANGAVGVSLAAVVRVIFSEAMDPLSISNGISLTNAAGALVASTVAYDSASNTAVLTPDSELSLSSSYTVVVANGAGGVKDVAGNALTNVFTASFTTTDQAVYSIWANSATPTMPSFYDPGDPNPYELGTRFRSEVAGYVTGVRFYKGAGNAGPHVGNLWRDSDQALLARVPFENETTSGWQYQAFTNPVPIAADTTYVVSYHLTNGRYAVDTAVQPGNLTNGVINPPLHALTNSPTTPNGVYLQSAASAFPTNSANGNNYWVDVVVVQPAVTIVSGLAADSKVYDGTALATLRTNGSVVLNGVIAGDVVELVTNGYAATFSAADVGAGLPVSVSGLSLGGPDASKYVLVQPMDLAANITPATVTPNITVADKTYDGTTAATITDRSLSGIFGSDDVNLGSSGSAVFVDKNVGTGKTVNITNLGLSGSTAINYMLAATNVSTTADISARSLVVAATGLDRVYDGTINATVTLSDNRVSGDVLSTSYATAQFSDRNVGAGKAVSVSGISIAGADAVNYVANPTTSTTADITPAQLTGLADGKSRVYGAANPPFTATYSGFVNGEDASVVVGSLSGSSAATTNSPVGSYAISVWGQSAPNYTIEYVEGVLAVVAAPLLVQAQDATRAYGQANPEFGVTISGWVNGEGMEVVGGELAVSSPAGTNSAVGEYPIMAAGLTATNYAIGYSNGTLRVTAYALSVVADSANRSYGAANPVLGGTISGIQNGDNITASYSTEAGTNSAVGEYAITISLLDPDQKLGNYAVSTTNGVLTVSPAALTVTADAQTKFYGQADPGLSYRITSGGMVNGEELSGALSRVAGENAGVYAIEQGTLTAGSNYTLSYEGAELRIWPAWLNAQADYQSREYGASNPELTISYIGFVGTDGVTNLTELPQASTVAGPGSPVGEYEITLTGGSASNYTLIFFPGILTVTPAELTVVANNTNRTYGASNPVFGGTISGIRNDDDITATYGSTATEASPVGTYPITPTLVDPGSKLANYNVSSINGTLQVTPAPLTGLADGKSRVYGAANPPFTATYSGFVNGEDASVVVGSLSGSSAATTNSPVGSYAISVWGQSAPNYTIEYVEGVLAVVAAPLLVQAQDATRAYGQANPEFGVTISGWVNGEGMEVVGGELAVSSPAGTNSAVGEYPIMAAGLTATNYAIGYSNGTLRVTAYALSVVADSANRSYGAANPVFSGTISGIQNGDNITATYATTATAVSPVGTYLITPTLVDPGNKLANYTVASTNGTLSVTAAALSVVANSTNRIYGAANPVFSGAISGIQNGDNITATYGTVATAVSPVGTYPITPTLVDPGNKLTNYTVSSTNGTLGVTAAALSVVANSTNRIYGAANPVFSGAISGIQNGDNITATYGTVATAVSPVGTYPITPTLVDPGNKLTNYTVSSTNGTLSVTAAALSVVANSTNRIYGAANPVFSGAISGIQNGDNITATYGTVATAVSPVGTYPITPTLVDPGNKLANYNLSSTNGTLQVTPAELMVIANNVSRPYGTANPVLTGTILGLQNNDNIVATYATTATQISPAGSYPITPTLVDPSGKLDNYAVTLNAGILTVTATTTPVILSIAPAGSGSVVITWVSISNSVYRLQYRSNLADTNWVDLAPDVVATGSTASYTDHPGNTPQRYYRVRYLSSVPPVAPLITSIVKAGTSNRVITWNAVSNQVYRVQYSAGLAGTTWLNLASNVTATGSTASYTDSPGAGPQRFYRVVLLTTVTPLKPLVVVADDALRVYGATNPVFGGSISGLQAGNNITATYSTTATVFSPAGTYAITPTLVDPNGKLDNYLVNLSNGTLTVTPAPLAATANNYSRIYGVTNPVLSGTLTGLRNDDEVTASYTTTATVTSPPGTYPIIPALADPSGRLSNYTVSITNGVLTVTPAPLMVTANNSSRPYGAANPAFTGTVVGLLNGDNITAAFTSPATPSSPEGTYPIVPSLADPDHKLSNYNVTSNNGLLTVTAPTAPSILSIVRSADNTNITITSTSVSNLLYRLQYKTGLTSTNWLNLASDVTATGSTVSFTDQLGTSPQRFYRAVLMPTVTPLTPLVVSANNASRPYGAANPVFSGTITGLQAGDNITATFSTTATISSPVGAYPILPTLADPDNKLSKYAVTLNNGTLTVTAPPVPRILSVVRTAGTGTTITWTSTSNIVYRAQYKTTLASTNWLNLAPFVIATGGTASFTDHPGAAAQRFYRIELWSP